MTNSLNNERRATKWSFTDERDEPLFQFNPLMLQQKFNNRYRNMKAFLRIAEEMRCKDYYTRTFFLVQEQRATSLWSRPH